MSVRWGAATKKTHGALGAQFVPRIRRDQNRIARADLPSRAVDLHVSRSLQQKIDLFAPLMVVPLSRSAHGQTSFGEALVLDWGVRQVQNTANLRSILGDERFLAG